MRRRCGEPLPKIVLSGFFGRGNCGDEAILQAQYEYLSPHFDLVISVDERGARDGFWDRYPYDRCRIVHQGNLGVLAEPDVIGMHVGGGGLPHGFNAAQVVHARSLGKPAFMTGVDATVVQSPEGVAALRGYMALFDYLSARSSAAWKTMTTLAPECHHGADWAVGFPVDDACETRRSDAVLVTIREFPVELITRDYLDAVADLLATLSDAHSSIVLVPFCPEDDRFLDHLPCAARLAREALWWDPRGMHQCIASASRIVSVGRLHPIVFAANVGTPAAFAEPLARDPRWPGCAKARQFCTDHEWPFFSSISDLVRGLRGGHVASVGAGFAPETLARWRSMRDGLRMHFEAAAVRWGAAPAAPRRIA